MRDQCTQQRAGLVAQVQKYILDDKAYAYPVLWWWRAVPHARELLRASAEDAQALNALANALFQCGQLDEARRRAEAILEHRRAITELAKDHPQAGDLAYQIIEEENERSERAWNFGLISAISRSRALLEAARAGTEVARHALVRGVDEAYYGAALATAKRTAAEQSLAAAEEFEHITALNEHAGEVPEVDVIRARLQTAARRDDLAQARQAETIANAALGTLLGYGITKSPVIEPLPQTIDVRQIDRFTAARVPHRPEFAQLEAQVRAAHADVRVARADLLPAISYSVDEGFDTPSLAPAELRKHQGILATANVDVPIFDWGVTWSRIRQAQLRARGAELQRELIIRDLYLQFATARQEALTAADRVENARLAVADAERNVSISVARYRAGEGSIVEATDALTTLATERLALQQSLFDYQVAVARLREAAGE